MKQKGFAPVIIIVLIAFGTAGYFGYKYFKSNFVPINQINSITPRPTPLHETPPEDPTANWKTYTNKTLGIQFKYPENYTVIRETPNIELGFGIGSEPPSTYLTISTKLTDFSLYKLCVSGSTPCFNNISWNQSLPIASTKLGGNDAKSIYYTNGVDTDTHAIQVTEPQKLELKMDIAGGKLDYNFQQILSTFKFLSTDNSNPSSPKTICTQEAKLCPDGSSVGRTGPNCEFAPCPSPY